MNYELRINTNYEFADTRINEMLALSLSTGE